MRTRQAAVALTLALAVSASRPLPGQDPGQAADAERLRSWVELEQSFTPEGRALAQERISALVASADTLDPIRFYLQVAEIVALADNGHSNAWLEPIHRSGLVGLATYWFSDGLRVVRATTANRHLLGARIVAVEGTPIEEVVRSLGRFHGGTDGAFREYSSMAFLLSPAVLHAAGLTAHAERAGFEMVLPDGSPETVALGIHATPLPRYWPWAYLLPPPADGAPEGWHSLFPVGTEMPLALGEPNQVFRYHLLANGSVAYIQLRTNNDYGRQDLQDFLNRVRRSLRRDRPRAVILDNRYNGGGDLTKTADFAMDLPSMVSATGRVFVLTSRATFSAGIYTSFFAKAADPARVTIVGERVGDRDRFWAETGDPFVLPSTGIKISYALQLHDLASGCTDRPRCHMARQKSRWNIAVGTLEPGVHISTTFGDFASGRDPQLEWVLEELGQPVD